MKFEELVRNIESSATLDKKSKIKKKFYKISVVLNVKSGLANKNLVMLRIKYNSYFYIIFSKTNARH